MKIIKYSIIVLCTALLAWGLPRLYHMATDQSSSTVFTYYSCIENAFCAIENIDGNQEVFGRNLKTGKAYSESEFDSILPMFYAKQLFKDERFPDTIKGQAVTLQDVTRQTFYYKYKPVQLSTPTIPIYTLFESLSGRVKLEMPGDVFRIHHCIEFINPATNQVNIEKSQRFMKALVGAGFSFPAKKAFGNPIPRKLYDEGYFIIDAKDHVFHLKMVNGKAFVKDIQLPAAIKPIYIAIREPQDKSHYGFLFDDKNKLYLISTNNYELQSIQTMDFNAHTDRLIIMANPFYWTTHVISSRGKRSLALDANSKCVVDSIRFDTAQKDDVVLDYLFPFELNFLSSNSEYVKPTVQFSKSWVWLLNIVLAFVFWIVTRNKNPKDVIMSSLWIVITGIFGFIICCLFKNEIGD